MNAPLVICILLCAAIASGSSQTFRAASLSLEAKEVGTGISTQRNWETDYGSYDRDYRKRKQISITVRDLSRKAPPLVAQVYFIARPLNGAPRFIYSQSALPVDLAGRIEATAAIAAPDLKSSVQNYAALGRKYVAGADIDGWIVVGEVNGQPFGIRASSQTLLEIAQGNPRQRESLAGLIREYEDAKHAE